ncbi:hypothetical protein [Reyranella sp.]|uniref:hypothetical protein n=1 Tax=Reyranella sp. TaxID=1929291 RepID=UPI003BABCCB6
MTMTLALFCAAPVGYAQSPTGRTTLSRAIELIDAHLEKAQRGTDADLKRRMQIEAYVALLSLPSTHRQYEAADWLRVTREPLEPLSGDKEVLGTGIDEAMVLADERSDLQRVYLIDRQYYGSSSGRGVERQYFWQVMRANDPDAMTWLFQSMQPAMSERGGATHRDIAINWLCQRGYRSLARTVAIRLTEPELDGVMGLKLAALGAAAEAEQRADRTMTRTTRGAPEGPEILVRLALMASRRGDSGEVERIVRKTIGAIEPRRFLPGPLVSKEYGDCDWNLARNFAYRWQERSVNWLTAYRPPDEHRDVSWSASQLVVLAESVAGASAGPRSVELIDRLIAIFDESARENGIDMMNAAILAGDPRSVLASLNWGAVSWYGSRQSLMLARAVAGGAIDDMVARALSLEWAMQFLATYPQSGLARRLITLAEPERLLIHRTNPRLAATLQLIALIVEGKGAEAHALRASDSAAAWLDGWRLTYLIETLENAGLRAQAVAALDAYLMVFPEKDRAVVRLLMLQGQSDKAKAMLREFAGSDVSPGGGFSEIFIGVMLLRELGDVSDIATFMRLGSGSDPRKASERLIEIVDAFAWDGAAPEIETAMRQLPPELANLSPTDAACLRDTLEGFLAVALSRRGDLEAGIRLVADRSLEQRKLCWPGEGSFKGYHSEPIFDVRYLVQEWARRGHAAP